jgi:hypothetical protein
MLDLLNTEDFGFWVPLSICKSARSTKSKGKDGQRDIEGIASTVHVDLQHEKVVQVGIDYSYFMEHGFFNNDHKPGFENKVGEPTECRVTKDGLYVKGFLYKEHKIANDIWEQSVGCRISPSQQHPSTHIPGLTLLKRWWRFLLICGVTNRVVILSLRKPSKVSASASLAHVLALIKVLAHAAGWLSTKQRWTFVNDKRKLSQRLLQWVVF